MRTKRQAEDSKEATSKPKRTPRQPRQKVTGKELEERFENWRELRATKRAERTPEEIAQANRRRAGVLLGVALLATALTFGVISKGLNQQNADNAAQIKELQTAIQSAEGEGESPDLGPLMVDLSTAASADAKKVATAQQHFSELFRLASTTPSPGNGAPNQAMVDEAAYRKEVAAFFDPSTFVVDDESAYQWQNTLPFDPNEEIDPRFAWYIRYDGKEAADPSTYAWSVETVTPTEDTTSASNAKAKVVWVCREASTGTILAWADAVYKYDPKTKKGLFDKLALVITVEGAKNQSPNIAPSSSPAIPQLGSTDPKEQP